MYNRTTHEGALAKQLSSEQELRRSVLSCLLWEDTFYEDGVSIAQRIENLAKNIDPFVVANLAIEAREKYHLRSVPLLLANTITKNGSMYVRKVLSKIIQRPDEIVKFMSIYWKNGKTPISKQVKLGISDAFTKFNEYQLAKWDRSKSIRLRDIMFLTHPKPQNKEMEELWYRFTNNKLTISDTWEVGLSTTKSDVEKKSVWERLLQSNKLGALALLKNLRNMVQVGVDPSLIEEGFMRMKIENIFPYRFITANRYAPGHSDLIEKSMLKCLEGKDKIDGKTILMVDVSGSMNARLDNINRIDTACGLAILLKELCEDIDIFTFSDYLMKVDDYHGFKLSENINNSQEHRCTYLGKSMFELFNKIDKFDRLIVITDEQSHDSIPETKLPGYGYIINIASYQNGINHDEQWERIDGFSESVIDWMTFLENEKKNKWFGIPDSLFTIK